MADGSIRIETIIDIKAAKARIKELEKTLSTLNAQRDKLNSSDEMQSLKNEMQFEKERYEAALKTAGTQREINNIEKEHSGIVEQIGIKHSELVDKANQQNAAIANTKSELEQVKQTYNELAAKKAGYETGGESTGNKKAPASNTPTIDKQSEKQVKATSAHASRLKGFLKSASSAAKGMAKALGGAALSGAKKLGSLIKSKLAGGLKNAASQAQSMHKKILKMSLALMGMRGIWGGIRQLVSSALSNNEQLQNSLNAAKGVLGQAITPIINYLVSALSKAVSFADQIYRTFTGTSLVAKYNSTQTKKLASETKKAAKSAKEYKNQMASFDVANKLEDNSSSSDTDSGAGGANAGASLFQPVDISGWMSNIIDQIKKGDWYSVGSTIAGAINSALYKIDWADIQGRVNEFCTDLGTAVNGFVDGLDWTAVGNTVAQGLNTITGAINSFVNTVDWANLGNGLKDAMNSLVNNWDAAATGQALSAKWKIIVETLHGFLYGTDGDGGFNFASLGSKFAEMFNAWFKNINWEHAKEDLTGGIDGVFTALDTFITGLDTGEISTAISSIINGLFNIDFKSIGKTLSDSVHFILDTLSKTISKIDWKQLGEDIAGFIQGIDWQQLMTDAGTVVGEALPAVLDAVSGFVETIDWATLFGDIQTAIFNFLQAVDWGAVVSSLSEVIGALIGAFFSYVTGAITTFLETAFDFFGVLNDFFGEHIEDAKKNGGSVADGILEGIGDIFKDIGKWIKKNILDPFIKGFKSAFGIHSPSTVMAEQGGYIVDGLKNGIGDVWSKIKEKFTTFLTGVKTWFSEKWESFKTLGSDTINKIKDGIGTIWDKIVERFDAFKTGLTTWFDEKAESFKELGSTMISKIKNGVGNVWKTIKEKFTSFWTNLHTWFTNKAESFKNLGKNVVSGIKNGISDHFHEVIDMLKNKIDNMVESVKSWLGIKSPSRVFRDGVGRFIALGLGEGIVDTIPEVVNDAKTLAAAVEDEIKDGDFTAQSGFYGSSNAVAGSLKSFAGTITDSFLSLVNSLEKIAGNIKFPVPFGMADNYKIAALMKGGIVNNPGGAATPYLNAVERSYSQPLNNRMIESIAALLSENRSEKQIVIPVYLDSQLISRYAVDNINRRAFELNKGGVY